MANYWQQVALATAVFAFAAASATAATDDQQPKAGQKSAVPAKAAEQKAQPAPAGAGGSMIFIDPATGKTRAPEPGEVEALTAPKSKSLSVAAAPTEFKSPTGAGVGVVLGEESMSYSVVTIGPDGKLKQSCVTGAQAATAVVNGKQTPAKEALDEK